VVVACGEDPTTGDPDSLHRGSPRSNLAHLDLPCPWVATDSVW